MRRTVLLVAALLLPTVARAQTHLLVGEWSVTYAAGVRMIDDVRTPIMATGTLSIVSEGDSLIATLKAEARDGAPARPPARFAARRVAGAITFVQRTVATLNLNGEESKRTVLVTYVLDATAEAVTGTLSRQVEGLDMPADAQPITGTRVKQ